MKVIGVGSFRDGLRKSDLYRRRVTAAIYRKTVDSKLLLEASSVHLTSKPGIKNSTLIRPKNFPTDGHCRYLGHATSFPDFDPGTGHDGPGNLS